LESKLNYVAILTAIHSIIFSMALHCVVKGWRSTYRNTSSI